MSATHIQHSGGKGVAVPDIIFVSMENWDEIWRRNQFLCAGILRRNPGTRILFVGLPHDVTHDLRRGRFKAVLRSLSRSGATSSPAVRGLTVIRPVKLLPNSLAMGRKVNDWLFRRATQNASRKLNLQRPALWLNPQSAVHMAGRMGECGVIYDITDDWTSLTQPAKVTALITAQDRQLCQLADATIVCSERLHEMKLPLARVLHLVPNGVDAEHYADATKSAPLPEAANGWTHPVLGYTGSVHADRVDIDLVRALAQQLQNQGGGTVALVGPILLQGAERQRLEGIPNVKLTGPVPYSQLPEWMRAFDACITPHLVTPFTESLNPLKLWEYLATGKPIISTPVAGFRDFTAGKMVRLANNANEFMAAWQDAADSVDEDMRRQLRRKEAMGQSWDSRLAVIEEVLAHVAIGK